MNKDPVDPTADIRLEAADRAAAGQGSDRSGFSLAQEKAAQPEPSLAHCARSRSAGRPEGERFASLDASRPRIPRARSWRADSSCPGHAWAFLGFDHGAVFTCAAQGQFQPVFSFVRVLESGRQLIETHAICRITVK